MPTADQIGEVRFPVTASMIMVVFVGCLTWWHYTEVASLGRTIEFFAACVASGGVILAAFYASKSFNHAARATASNVEWNKQEILLRKKENALNFAARWNDANMYHVRDAIREIFACRGDDGKLATCIGSRKTNVINFLNFLEERAISIEADVVDQELIKVQFKGTLISGWHTLEAWVKEHRKEHVRPKLWIKLENLVSKWTAD